MRKVAVEYVELCGMKHGDNQHNRKSDNRISLDEIAKQLGMGRSTLAELLMLERKLTPEVKELIDSGVISKTSASKIWVKLSEMELLEELGKDKITEMTQKQIQIRPLETIEIYLRKY